MTDFVNSKGERARAPESFHRELARRRLRWTMVFVILATAFVLITILNINTGSVHLSAGEIAKVIFSKEGSKTQMDIIWRIRLPRILMAAILGGALSLSGFMLQTFFENPIAGPFVLGISSGAKMVVALVMIFYMRQAISLSSYALIFAAFIGSLIATGFILLVSRKLRNMAALLVAGIMIGHI